MTSFSVCDEKTQYACPLGGCIPVHKRCDGVVDCQNGLDENYCRKGLSIWYPGAGFLNLNY